MFDKLHEIETTYNKLNAELYDSATLSDPQKTIEINKKLSLLQEIYDLFQQYKKIINQFSEAKKIIETEKDSEMIDLAKSELQEAETQKPIIEEQLKIALLPKDPNDDKNIYLEIRAAAGGDESGLFGAELMRMYLRYAEKQGRRVEIQENQISDIGGLKFAMIKISGYKVYSKLKFESGVHRVQRIPETEANGRVHTSTVTVAVIPEVEDIEVNIDMNDIEMDTYAASSAGGQNANKNQTGVRIHHKPTGIIVNIGDSKSQLQNKEKAFTVLKAKLWQIEFEKQQQELKDERINQIGSGDRSEKIRTYNYPQDRITDHRIKKSWSNIPVVMAGEIDDIINSLIVENQAKMLSTQKQD